MNDFGKQLININVDEETLKQAIISQIEKNDNSTFNIQYFKEGQHLKITIQSEQHAATFEIYNLTSEALEIVLQNINKYIKENFI